MSASNKANLSPLHLAVAREDENLEILQTIIQNVKKPLEMNVADLSGLTPLHHAVLRGRMEKVKMLLMSPLIDINARDVHQVRKKKQGKRILKASSVVGS